MVFEKVSINNDYQIIYPPLGQGTFGTVYKAIHHDTQQFRAVKVIRKHKKSKHEQDLITNEMEILKDIDHPNILKIFEFYQDENKFYIVSELCQGGEIFDFLINNDSISEQNISIIMK